MAARALVVVNPRFMQRAGLAPTATPGHQPASAARKAEVSSYEYLYLFGDGERRGTLRQLEAHGFETDVIGEDSFRVLYPALVEKYDLCDLQFASHIPAACIDRLMARSCAVLGWIPSDLASKSAQALLLAASSTLAPLLPRQVLVSNLEQLARLTRDEIVAHFGDAWLIVKSAIGTGGRMPDGSDYLAAWSRDWELVAERFRRRPEALRAGKGLVVSELVTTRDPYLCDRNAVVHKVHVMSGLNPASRSSWSFDCWRVPAQVELPAACGRPCDFSELRRGAPWQPGNVASHRARLQAIAELFSPFPCLLCEDVMLRRDGRCAFLEVNKIAGTFGDRFSPAHPSALDARLDLALAMFSNHDCRADVERYQQYRERCRRVLARQNELVFL